MAVTIIDVAKKAGVSISTVSKFLNGGKVRETNRIRIGDAIRELDYHPNKAAQGLKTDRTFQVGLMISSLSNAYISELTEEYINYSRQIGYHIIITTHHDDIKRAAQSVTFLLNQQVDGIIYLPILSSEAYMEDARSLHLPMVAIDRPDVIPGDMVGSNSASGSYDAVEYLIRNGHRKIGIITGTNTHTLGMLLARDRLTGYLRVLQDYRIPVKESFIQDGSFTFKSGYQAMNKLWQQEDRPTAVYVSNYNMAVGAIAALNNMKVSIPEDLSFVMFDDFLFSTLASPPLTAVRQPLASIVKGSFDLLLKRISGNYDSFPEIQKYPTQLIIRESVRSLIH